MSIRDKLLNDFNNKRLSGKTLKEICGYLAIPKNQRRILEKELDKLCESGDLVHDSHYRYFTPEQMGSLSGKISANKGGFAFLIPDDRDKYPTDFFIPGRKLNGALHGDHVLAVPTGGGKGDEALVLRVLERGYNEIIGILYQDRHGYFVRPDEERYAEDIFIPKNKTMNAMEGTKVVVKLTSFPKDKAPGGEVIEILGDSDDFFVEELSIIRAHGLREEFPAEVKKAAAAVPSSVEQADLKGRLDLRDKLIITVDGEDTRDIDDAISLEMLGDDYLLGVHIADVSHYVTFNSVLDKEAFKRGTSAYFPDRVLPMLPRELSNGICSLNEDVDRLALSCIMQINKQGKVVDSRIEKSVIHSTHRMTYHQIEDIANGKKDAVAQYPDLVEFLRLAFDLTDILRGMRHKKGEVELDVKEAKIMLDEEDNIVIPDYERMKSQQMIEQFMVLANETVAEFMTEKKMPFVYRIHEKPKAEKAENLKLFLLSLGISPTFDVENVTPRDYRKILDSVKDLPYYYVINQVMLRSMMKARYDSINVGHFGLSSECYCHFTSPIRRYPDLCIHRIIKLAIEENYADALKLYAPFVSEAAIRSSDCEKKATEAERDVDDLYKVAYMDEHIGERFDGIISGVTNFGIFVELPNTIEGMVAYEYLPEDDYEFFEDRFLLRGKNNSFKIGEPVNITVAGCDFANRKIAFSDIKKL